MENRPSSRVIGLATAVILAASMPTLAQEIMSFKDITISSAANADCTSPAQVRLDAASLDQFHRSRLDLQEVAKISKAYLWLDCPDIESIEFTGYVEDEEVYAAEARADTDWYLREVDTSAPEEVAAAPPTVPEDPAPDAAEPPAEPSGSPAAAGNALAAPPPAPANTGNVGSAPEPAGSPASQSASKQEYDSLEQLQRRAAKGDPAAQIALAQGQLDLDGRIADFEFDRDSAAGVATLERLADAGNADAMHQLAAAYLQDPELPVNEPLVERVTQVELDPSPDLVDGLRGAAAALLTMKAAAEGDPGAVAALNEAGAAGSASSHYALGMMYILDQMKKLPYDPGFLEQELQIEESTGAGNVDIGLHFLELAAQAGDANAQEMLDDLGLATETNPEGEQVGSATDPLSPDTTSGNLLANAAAVEPATVIGELLGGSSAGSAAGASGAPGTVSGGGATGAFAGGSSSTSTQAGGAAAANSGASGRAGRAPGGGRAAAQPAARTGSASPQGNHSEQGRAPIID